MTSFNSWAATVSLTITASFFLAIHDASYRPAFVQIATMAVLVPKASKIESTDNSDSVTNDDNSSVANHPKKAL